jgi:serine/threonine protein kinase
MSETGVAIIVTGIVAGMRFIHACGFMHRDLKPGNILLDADGRPKIADLGSSRLVEMGVTPTSTVGSPLYMAPEIYEERAYDKLVDVYSFALILFEVLAREPAFPVSLSPATLMMKITGGVRPPLPTRASQCARTIIERCWNIDPQVRMSFDEIWETLSQNRFVISPGVDGDKVAQFVESLGTPRASLRQVLPRAGPRPKAKKEVRLRSATSNMQHTGPRVVVRPVPDTVLMPPPRTRKAPPRGKRWRDQEVLPLARPCKKEAKAPTAGPEKAPPAMRRRELSPPRKKKGCSIM